MITSLSVRDLTHILFKRLKIAVWFFIACVGLTGLYLYVTPPKFRSDAAVVVRLSSQDLASPELNQPQRPPAAANAELAKQIVNSHIAMLESMDLRRDVIRQLGVARVYPKLAEKIELPPEVMLDVAVEQLGKDLDSRVGRDSSVLLISLLNADPAVAQEALRVVITAFMGMQARVMRDPRSKFLQEQLDMAQKQVESAQNALLDFKRQNGISALDQERTLLLKQRSDIEASTSEALTKLADAEKRRDALAGSLKGTPREIPISNENDRVLRQTDDALVRLNAARLRLQQATSTYAPGNPLLSDVRAEMEMAQRNYRDLQAASQSRVRSGINTVYQALSTSLNQTEADLAAVRAVAEQWNRQLAAVSERISRLDGQEGELLGLQRKLDLAVQAYTTYLERSEQARVSEDLNLQRITSLGIVQEPNLPYKPASPRVLLLLAIAIMAGGLGAIALCFGLETMDETVSRGEQLKPQLGVPVLAVLNMAAPKS
jgi:uncharacterized protein involved in exopolysaccharide biosynthesis